MLMTVAYLEVSEESCFDKLPYHGIHMLVVEAVYCAVRAVTEVVNFARYLTMTSVC
jgi:hypothetical protein